MYSNKSDFFRDLDELDQLSDDAQTNVVDFSTLLRTPSSPASSSKVSKLKSAPPTIAGASSTPQILATMPRDEETRPKTSADTLSESRSEKDNEMKQSINTSNVGQQRGRKKRRTESSRVIPESRQIFKGLTFFFIPNNGTAPARKLRIQRSQEYGAIWAQTWSASVTHVIVDKGLNFEEICKVLSSEQLAVSVRFCSTLGFSLRGNIGKPNDRQSRLPF